MIYLDPPFFSKKDYESIWIKDKATKMGFSDKDWDKLKDKVNPDIIEEYESIEERWRGGKNGIHVYIAYMRERLDQCWRVLKDTGSIYLHCDWHASHYLKIMLDEVFGYSQFRNEIVWRRSHNKGTGKKLSAVHDVILFYSKTEKPVFNTVKIEHDPEYIRKFYRFEDSYGRYRLVLLTGAGQTSGGESGKPWRGIDPNNRHWAAPREFPPHMTKPSKYDTLSVHKKLDVLDKLGLIYWPKKKMGVPQFKRYLYGGTALTDVITDINPLYSNDSERMGYPTQKPLALLERLIKTSSNEGDLILDPFCGCGTTLASSQRLKRKWIGIDISRTACDVMVNRLGGSARVVGCESPEELQQMDPHDFARLVIVEKLNGTINRKKSGDGGIDGWIELLTVPVQVKRWKHKVGRPEIDKFKTAIERDRKETGIIVAHEFSRDAINEVARIKKDNDIVIELRQVKDVFGWSKYDV